MLSCCVSCYHKQPYNHTSCCCSEQSSESLERVSDKIVNPLGNLIITNLLLQSVNSAIMSGNMHPKTVFRWHLTVTTNSISYVEMSFGKTRYSLTNGKSECWVLHPHPIPLPSSLRYYLRHTLKKYNQTSVCEKTFVKWNWGIVDISHRQEHDFSISLLVLNREL